MILSKILYTTKVKVTGGREGEVKSEDGKLNLKLAAPKEMGGDGSATNPEQMFAGGYAACFFAALKMVAGKKNIAVSDAAFITAEVGIGPLGQGFGLQVTLELYLPGMDKDVAKMLVDTAHQVCPYSNATRNNIDVTINIKTA